MTVRRTTRAASLVVAVVLVAGCGPESSEGPDPSRAPGSTSAAGSGTVALSGATARPGRESWTPWPQAMHDAQHSGAASVTGPRSDHVRWTRRLEGNVTPGPVVAADGTVYAASNSGVLHAIDPDTGKDRWTVDGKGSYGIDLSTSPAVMPSGMVLWPGPGGTLLAVAPDGTVRWRMDLGGLITSPAVRADGLVVVGNDAGVLVGLRPTEQGPGGQWRVDLGEQSYGSAALSVDGRTAYQSTTSGVFAVAVAKEPGRVPGNVLWHAEPASDIVEVSAAVAPDETVVVGSNDHHAYGLDPSDGSTRWDHDLGFTTYSSPVVTHDDIAYLGDHGDRITGLDAVTGRVRYRALGSTTDDGPGGIGVWTSVLVDAAHTTYAGTRQGLVYAADRDGRVRWSLDTGATVDSYPALTGDGGLVIGSSNGTLLMIGD